MLQKSILNIYLIFLLFLIVLSFVHIFIPQSYFNFTPRINLNETYLLTFLPKKTSIDKNCSAIDTNSAQFKINIDGINYPNILPLYHNRSINFKCLNSSKTIKTILMWTKFNGAPLIKYDMGIRTPFEKYNCPVTNCELTNDRSKFNKSQLVLFHLRNQIDSIPERAFQNQRYVHVIYESPVHCHLCTKYENVFNFSANYRIDSDFTSLYWSDSGLYWDLNKKFNESFDFFQLKKFRSGLDK